MKITYSVKFVNSEECLRRNTQGATDTEWMRMLLSVGLPVN